MSVWSIFAHEKVENVERYILKILQVIFSKAFTYAPPRFSVGPGLYVKSSTDVYLYAHSITSLCSYMNKEGVVYRWVMFDYDYQQSSSGVGRTDRHSNHHSL